MRKKRNAEESIICSKLKLIKLSLFTLYKAKKHIFKEKERFKEK